MHEAVHERSRGQQTRVGKEEGGGTNLGNSFLRHNNYILFNSRTPCMRFLRCFSLLLQMHVGNEFENRTRQSRCLVLRVFLQLGTLPLKCS